MTPHFTMDEFTHSATAASRHIDNTLPADLAPAARDTLLMLERIRAYLSLLAGRDVPMLITSGYRSLELNAAIGSIGKSDHPRGMAADWVAPTFGTPTEICRVLAPQVGQLGIGQLINERDGHGNRWVHVGTSMPPKLADRLLTITEAAVVRGIVEA